MGFDLTFDDKLTVIVGENDAGKTSVLDSIKIITQSKDVTVDDFFATDLPIVVELQTDSFKYIKTFNLVGLKPTLTSYTGTPTRDLIGLVSSRINSPEFDLEEPVNQEELKKLAKQFGVSIKGAQTNTTTRTKLNQALSQSAPISEPEFPQHNGIQLDGKHFENIPAFFKELFLKEKQKSIWEEKVDQDVTLIEFIHRHLQNFSNEVSEQIKMRGLVEKLQSFLGNLNEIKIESVFQLKEMALDELTRQKRTRDYPTNINSSSNATGVL